MNYIYDIVLNFQEHYYQFFEWSRRDKIKNIKSIPLFHIDSKDLEIFKNNSLIISKKFLDKITNASKQSKANICLVSDKCTTIGLLFDDTGRLLKRSSLLFEEEEEANKIATRLPKISILYEENIEAPKEKNIISRLEREKKDALLTYLHQTTSTVTLKYLYYQYFQKESDDITKIKQSLTQELEKNWTSKQNNLYQIIALLVKNNLPIQ